MPIEGVIQPVEIKVDERIRLRKYDGRIDFALQWYQDLDLVYLVDGVKEVYSYDKLKRMYDYLNCHGELYFIEVLENNKYMPIGDVTFYKDDMPIVIGDSKYHGKHIGRKVIFALVKRGKELGYNKMYVKEIYDYNIASRKCFESVGFREYEKTEKGNRYVLDL